MLVPKYIVLRQEYKYLRIPSAIKGESAVVIRSPSIKTSLRLPYNETYVFTTFQNRALQIVRKNNL